MVNIVTPILTAIAYPTANLNTESARRDNVLRDTIPQPADAEKGASQKGLGSEGDKTKNPGQSLGQATYDRPQIQTELQSAFDNLFGDQKDNGSDESAGKQNAQDQQSSGQQASQSEQLSEEDQQEISDLEARDQEVRTHEQAHAAAGGQYAGSPQYEYTTGPDNKRYVTDGEVSIDISESNSPEETLRKMEQVRTAALAPAEPSSQDLKVAAEAAQKSNEARIEIAKQRSESGNSLESDVGVVTSHLNDEITNSIEVRRELDDSSLQAPSSAMSSPSSDPAYAARAGRIQNFYNQTSTPIREGLSVTA